MEFGATYAKYINIFLYIVIFPLVFIIKRKEYNTVIWLVGFLFFITYVIITLGRTIFEATDWSAYKQSADYLDYVKFFGGDYLFWLSMAWLIELFNHNDFFVHLFIKSVSIFSVFFLTRSFGVSAPVSLYVVMVFTLSKGSALGNDWYIRQWVANILLLLAFALYSKMVFFKKKICLYACESKLSVTQFVVPFTLAAVALFIHSGMVVYLLLLTVSSCFSIKQFSSNKLLITAPSFTRVIFNSIYVSVGGFLSVYLILFYFAGWVPAKLYEFPYIGFPFSLAGHILLLLYFIYFLSVRVKKSPSGYEKWGIFFLFQSMVFVNILLITLSFSFELPYLLRVNMFKDLYLCLTTGFIIEGLFRIHPRNQGVSIYALILLFINFFYLGLIVTF